jgi:hypothetical protein
MKLPVYAKENKKTNNETFDLAVRGIKSQSQMKKT